MNTDSNTNAKPTHEDFEIFFGQMIMHHTIEELVSEHIVLNVITDINKISLQNYIDIVGDSNKYINKAMLNLSAVTSNFNDIIEDFKKSGLQNITKDYFYEKLCGVFNNYFMKKQHLNCIENAIIDENGLPDYFPMSIKRFIKNNFITFQNLAAIKESFDFSDILDAKPVPPISDYIYSNCAIILTLAVIGRIRQGRDISSLLFKSLPKTSTVPNSFKRLCRIKNGKYIICNTNIDKLEFKLAVFDLIEFKNLDNKLLFNNKVNQYLKNLEFKNEN